MFTMHTPPAPPVPVWFPPKGSILSSFWTHAITTIMGHPLSSESGKSIQEWILYHAIQYPIEFGSTGTPLTLMTLNYFKNMVEVMDQLYISQAAQSRVSSASGTI